jgi:hypothetical protein
LRLCEEGGSERFGRVEFAVGCDVTEEFKAAVAEVAEGECKKLYVERDGQYVETDRQWAEVCFVPNEIGRSNKGAGISVFGCGGATEAVGAAWDRDSAQFSISDCGVEGSES